MAKYSLVMTPTPCRVAGCITGTIRPTYSCARALIYLLTYLHSWLLGLVLMKPAISPKRLKIERKLLRPIKSNTGFRLSPKCMTLNDLWARFKVIYSLNVVKMTMGSYIIMTPTPCRVAGSIISFRPTYSCSSALTYLLTYLLTYSHRITSVSGDWPVI